MSRNRRSFTPEFKQEAAELALSSEKTIAQVARDLGVGESNLGKWVSDHKAAQAGSAPSTVERAEMRDLKRQLRNAEMERDILAKAVAFFSRETR